MQALMTLIRSLLQNHHDLIVNLAGQFLERLLTPQDRSSGTSPDNKHSPSQAAK